MVIIAPSVLGYQEGRGIEGHEGDIRALLEEGIQDLHIDIMRNPFTPGTDRFDNDAIGYVCSTFAGIARLDFHLMIHTPDEMIDSLAKLLGEREQHTITIHREAYRPLDKWYTSKEYDLLREAEVEDLLPEVQTQLREAQQRSGERVLAQLDHIATLGFQAGIALEPGTSLENVTEEMAAKVRRLLLMSVCSGAGGQAYIPDVTQKIRDARTRYPSLMIQVDGGINAETGMEASRAGAGNLVVGSYITRTANPAYKARELQMMLRGASR